MTPNDPEESNTLLVAEEIAEITKTQVRTGQVQVRTVTETVEEIVRASLNRETVRVTRVAIDREVETVPVIRTEGDLTIIPIFEEVLFVETRLVLKEEIHIQRMRSTVESAMPVSLRKQRAVVEREDDATPADRSDA